MIKDYIVDMEGKRARLEISDDLTEREYLIVLDFFTKVINNMIEEAKRDVCTLDSPIEDLDLPVRLYNILKRSEINVISDLNKYSKSGFMSMRNMNEKTYKVLKDRLKGIIDINEEE